MLAFRKSGVLGEMRQLGAKIRVHTLGVLDGSAHSAAYAPPPLNRL